MRARAVLLGLVLSICCKAQPVIGGIANSASFTGQLVPGGLASIFGTGLATSAQQASSFPLPPTLGGVSVVIGSFTCPLLFANSTQVNFQIPYEVTPGTQQIVVNSSIGEVQGLINIDEAGPALFQYGTNQAIAVNYSTGAVNGPDAPVQAGDYLIVYMTGVGPVTTPEPADGSAANGLYSATDSYSATIGSMDATVSFLGLAPGYAGLGQANIQVPNLANGDYPLSITVNGIVSTSAVVSVSGTGTVEPNILTYVTGISVPTGYLQTNVVGSTVVQTNSQYAFVCSATQITAVDISTPQTPVFVNGFGISELNGLGTNCILSGSYLVDIVNASQFVVFNVNDPTNPTIVTGLTNLDVPLAGHLVFDGNTLLLDTIEASWSTSTNEILSEAGSLEAYDFSNFSDPVFDGTYTAPSGFTPDDSPRYQLAPLNSEFFTTPYVAMVGTTNTGGDPTSGQGVLDVLDISNPAAILGVTEIAIPQTVVLQEIALQGTEALVAGNTQAWNNPITYNGNVPQFLSMGDLTLSVVDFTNPQSPSIVSNLVTGIGSSADPYLVSLGGGFFAISHVRSFSDIGGAGTLAVIDASNPSSLNWIPVANLFGVYGMAVENGYLYVATSGGLNVYQITLPAQPTLSHTKDSRGKSDK